MLITFHYSLNLVQVTQIEVESKKGSDVFFNCEPFINVTKIRWTVDGTEITCKYIGVNSLHAPLHTPMDSYHACTYGRMPALKHERTHERAYTHARARAHALTRAPMHTCARACTQARAHAHRRARMHKCACMHACTHARAHHTTPHHTTPHHTTPHHTTPHHTTPHHTTPHPITYLALYVDICICVPTCVLVCTCACVFCVYASLVYTCV